MTLGNAQLGQSASGLDLDCQRQWEFSCSLVLVQAGSLLYPTHSRIPSMLTQQNQSGGRTG
ncbi:hypothetical protein Pyn_17616 [Prunus yedoensis var. nudiflora]|uniref:Uncharacterized protein n=1 Tax=Prunus yedoensis var. nudiflora TaxID=2094558 RepID=A0A314V4F8_PRUYE|nr:hypothetical protein Pyn_17616 [Prunus yedoensis var. nudiflora]